MSWKCTLPVGRLSASEPQPPSYEGAAEEGACSGAAPGSGPEHELNQWLIENTKSKPTARACSIICPLASLYRPVPPMIASTLSRVS